MEEEKIRNWVEEKLDDGIRVEKVKNALEDHGYDPSIVDEVKDERSEASEEPLKIPDNFSEDYSSDEEVEEETESEEQKDEIGEEKSVDEEEIKPPVDETRRIAEDLENSVRSKGKRGLAVVSVVVILLLGAVYLPSVEVPDLPETGMEKPDEPVNTSRKMELPSDFQGEKVVLKEGSADPSRPSINPGEELAFVNKNSYSLEISFESWSENLTVRPMNYSISEFNTISYYTGYPESEGKTVKGSVYVR